jgi:hypothetical protein
MDVALLLGIYGAALSTFIFVSNRRREARREQREQTTDVRVTVRPEIVGVDSGKVEFTVVATNDGATSEAVERVGLHMFKTRDGHAGFTTYNELDQPLPPKLNVRHTFDLVEARYVRGFGAYRGYAVLTSGDYIESEWGDVDHAAFVMAGILPPDPPA